MGEIECIEYYAGVIRGRLVDIERNAGDQQEKVKKLQGPNSWPNSAASSTTISRHPPPKSLPSRSRNGITAR